jgi:hypothetical protein
LGVGRDDGDGAGGAAERRHPRMTRADVRESIVVLRATGMSWSGIVELSDRQNVQPRLAGAVVRIDVQTRNRSAAVGVLGTLSSREE